MNRVLAVIAMILVVVGGYWVVGRLIRTADALDRAQNGTNHVQAVLETEPNEP